MIVLFERLFWFYLAGVMATMFLWLSQYLVNKHIWEDALEHIIKASSAKDKNDVYSAIFMSCLLSWLTILAFIYVKSMSPK
jgi:hypothetical protein